MLEAPLLIEQKARDMMRHYASVVLPEGFKAQVVATSRQAAVTYHEKLEQARQQLVTELEALPPTLLALPEDEIEQLDAHTRFLVRTHSELAKLRALEIAAVISLAITTTRNRGGTGPTKPDRRTHQALQAAILLEKNRQDRPAVHPGRQQHAADGVRCARGASALPRPQDRRA